MEEGYFPLGNTEDNRFVKIVRIIFGIACIVMAAWWINFNIKSSKMEWSIWATIIFLLAFGFYQVWSGLGHATRYIIVKSDRIVLKKSSMNPAVEIIPGTLKKIDIFPLSIWFIFHTGRKMLLRFGTIHYETNEKIVDEIIRFAGVNGIPFEINEETLLG